MTTIDGRPSRGDQDAVDRAQAPPGQERPQSDQPASAAPARASRPATTPQMLKSEPIEMSIWRQRITSVIPTAATSTGALLTTSGAELVRPEEAAAPPPPGRSRMAHKRRPPRARGDIGRS